MGPSGCDDIWPKGEIRYELTVHNIPLNEINASLIECRNFLTEARKICREN